MGDRGVAVPRARLRSAVPLRAGDPEHATGAALLELIRLGGYSRADLARATGLSSVIVGRLVEELVQSGAVHEVSGATRTGRSGKVLGVAADGPVVLAVVVRDGWFHLRVSGLDGTVVGDEEHSGHTERSADAALADRIWTAGRTRTSHPNAGSSRVVAIVCVDGRDRTASDRGASRGPGPLAAGLEERSGIAVWVGREVDALCWSGPGDPVEERPGVLSVLAGRRVEVAFRPFHDPLGTAVRGRTGTRGGLGGERVSPDVRRDLELGWTGPGPVTVGQRSLAGPAVDDVGDAVERARSGSVGASCTLRRAGEETGRMLASVVTFADPSEVVLGGPLAGSAHWVAGFRAGLLRSTSPALGARLAVRVPGSSVEGPLRGATMLALELVTIGALR